MQGRWDMQPSKPIIPHQSTPTSEPRYEPPQVEAVVTAAELERESLYAGDGAYAGFA